MGVKRSPQFRMLVVVILLAFLSQTAWAQVMPAGSSGYYEGSSSKEEEGVIVPPDYQLGPGDVVLIMLKGEISGEWRVPIDLNGYMNLPRAEAIRVLGLNFSQLQAAIHQTYSKYFKNFELRVAMEQLRAAPLPPIPEEELPSPEELKTLSDAELDRLFLSAPPSEVMKRLPRFGYDFFLRPTSTFAPVEEAPVGPDYVIGPGDQVKIFIWGMVEGEWSAVVDRDGSLNLPRAGVINAAGLTFSQLQEAIRRAYSRYYTNFEINVTMGRLRSITVYVVGSAKRPGAYTVSSLATVVNALIAAGGPDVAGSMRDIELRRNNKTVAHFDMYDLLLKGDTSKDLRLMPGDVIFIPPAGVIAGVVGSVKRPGLYELKERVRLGEFIEMAGGMTGHSFKGRVQVMRVEGRRYQTLIEGDMDALGQDFLQKFAVQDGDIVRVFPVARIATTMRVAGPVASPGEYAVEPGITRVIEVINRAGGLLYMASNQAELTRIRVTQMGPVTDHILINLEKALQNDPEHDIPLENNDYLFVRAVPEWALYRTATVTGEVKYPGTYTVRKGETLSSLIERAGGYTDKAYLKGAIFLRESVRKEQQKSINEMVDRLERELYSAGTAATATSFNAEEAQIVSSETEQKRKLLDTLRRTRATGRVVVRLEDPPELLKRTPFDIELEEGDRLHIPKKPQTVQVVGSVLNETSFVFEPYRRHSYYIQKAGGYGVNADRKRTYLLKADGSAVRVGNLKKPPHLEEGDTVVVPEKIQVTSRMRDTAHIIDMVYKVAISAAVVVDALDD